MAESSTSSWWEDASAAWSAVADAADSAWKSAYKAAEETWRDLVEDDPEKYQPDVQAFAEELTRTRELLDTMRPKLPPSPAATPEDQRTLEVYAALEQRYQELAAPFYADARPADSQIGLIPLMALLIAGSTIVVGGAAAAWALPALEYATGLREQTELAARELDARVAASEQGRTLQASTLPAASSSSPMGEAASRLGIVLIGGAAALGAVVFFTRR